MEIAWLGLGHMGLPMAARMAAAGHVVHGYDIDASALERGALRGIRAASSAASAVRSGDFVVTMLPRPEHVRDAYLGADGILEVAGEGHLLLDCSTIDPATAITIHDRAAELGRRFVEAPVSGGIPGAEGGTLTFMIAGTDLDVAAVGRLVEPMAAATVHTGGPGTAQAAKICNNLILFSTLVATAEGALLAERLGLDREVFWRIASQSSADSWALRNWYPLAGPVAAAPSSNGYQASFPGSLAIKDVSLALDAAAAAGLRLRVGDEVLRTFAEMEASGLGHLDCSAVVKVLGEVD